MFFNENKSGNIYATVKGKLKPITDVKDEMFANNLMGQGLAIDPVDKVICSPIAGKLTLVADTLHAFGIEGRDGLQVLVHIGVDTVKYNGHGFKQLKEVGCDVHENEAIIEFDYSYYEKEGIDTSVMTIILNSQEFMVTNVIDEGEATLQSCVAKYKKI